MFLAIIASLLQWKKPFSKAKRRQRGEDFVAPEISLDLMIEILYMVCRKACIYNPTTRQSLTLPAIFDSIQGFEKYVHYFLGHDPVLDQYKVVYIAAIPSKDSEIITSEHWVFVLEVGGSWKRIVLHQPHFPTIPGVCINGDIYYLAEAKISREFVVSFDVRSEEFSMIQAPHVVTKFAKYVGFIEYGGRPAILDHTNLVGKGLVELWVLEDGGKWSKQSLVLQPCQMHLVDNTVDSMVVKGTTRNGEVILAP